MNSPEVPPGRSHFDLRWWRSLRTQIIAWFFVPTALLLIAVAVTNFFAYQDVTADLVIERDQDVTRLSASQLSNSLREFTDTLEEVGRGMDPSQPAGPSRFPVLQTSGGLSVFDSGVVVLDTFGTPVAARPQDAAGTFEDWSSLPLFRELVRSTRPAFSNVLSGGAGDDQLVAIGVPIKGPRGELLGATVGMFDVGATSVSALYGRIVRLRINDGGVVYLVDDTGRVIYHSAIAFAGSDFSSEAAVQNVLTSGVGALRTTSGAGEDIVAAYSPVPGTPWNLVSEASWLSLTSGSRGYQQLLLVLLALGILAPIAIVTVGIRRLMRPVDELIAAARAVGAGDLSRRIESPSGDEIGVLATSFNQMASELQGSYRSLERRVAERTEELRESEERYRTLFEQSVEAIFMTSADGKVIDVNQAAVDLFGFTRHELIERDYADRFVDPGDRERMRTAIAAGGGTVRDFELRLRKGDGTVMDCVLTVRRRGATEGTPAGLEGTVRDVTAAKRTEEELFAQTREMAVLDERNRMAREIHDTLAQGFTGIVLQLEAGEQALGGDQEAAAAHIERAKSLARESLQEARRSVWDLVPEILEARSLEDALKEEVQRFAARGIEKAAFTHTGKTKDLPRDVQAALLRICQEALMNARKHARARRVDVRLEVGPDAVSLVVQDDGVGFDPDAAASTDGQQSGYGMTSMGQRARLQGGTLTIQSGGDKGTVIEAKIPTAISHQSA